MMNIAKAIYKDGQGDGLEFRLTDSKEVVVTGSNSLKEYSGTYIYKGSPIPSLASQQPASKANTNLYVYTPVRVGFF